MAIAGLKVLTIGNTWNFPSEYQVKVVDHASEVVSSIARFQPDVIVTSKFAPSVLYNQGFNLKKKWIHVPPDAALDQVMLAIENCYIFNIWGEHPGQVGSPLMSVYTPTYNTGDHLREAYQSLREQTYANWEWVVMDDCSTDGTWERLIEIAKDDIRVRPFRAAKKFGKIGAVKDAATRLTKGEYLVELDHDDFLVDTALDEVKNAFQSDPGVGFVYSNSSNFFENGQFQMFGDEFWKDRYRQTEYRGKKWTECLNPDFYGRFGPDYREQFAWFLTVGPNHVRAFRAKKFFELGGYNPNLLIADDWDLMARFFLYSKAFHVNKFLYGYRIRDNWENSTFTMNQAIQDHLTLGRGHYAAEFEKKNRELLSGKKEIAPDEILLTIAVCTMPSRMESFAKISKELFRQAEGKPVEVFCFLDNRKSNLSEKRNVVIEKAKGRFISFVDDDDWVEPDYVERILAEIVKEPEADCVVFDVLVQGYTKEPKLCKYDVAFQHGEDEKAYYRKPNHVMAYRTEISRRHGYKKELSAISEDTEWAERASKDIKKQVRVDKALYHYLYNAAQTTQVNPAPQAAPAASTGGRETAPIRAKVLKDVSFVVLEAVPDGRTTKCLRSIRQFASDSEIVLVANGSKPFTESVTSADKVIYLDANLGYAAGCTAGAEAATKSILCFMNNDAVFVDETPKKLIEALTEEFAIVGPYSNRAKPPQGDIERSAVPAQDQHPEMIVGLCMMIPKELYQTLGGFDPRLLTYEDDDFCRRAAVQAGKKCKVVGGTWVDHERHATFKALGLDVNRVMAENGEIFRKKNPKIRVIVIAKDEEKALAGFFMQFADVTRDWCVLDTGSKDRTVEIAKNLGARVETAAFVDFAAARNEALKRFRDGADWIIMFDPDERLERSIIENIQELVFRTEFDIFLSPLHAVYPDGGKRDFVAKAFLWRNLPEIQWVFKVHEKVIGSKKQALIRNSSIAHWLTYHEDGRRQQASGFYDGLMRAEPYFTDPAYKEKMIQDWPILDYDRMDDPRLAKIYVGPLICVVTPTYRRTGLLDRAVRSALAQDYVNLEVVVVGDSCPDLPGWRRASDPRLRVLNLNRNHGAGGAVPRNHAIMAAAGNLIAYLDDDNTWKKDHVSSVYEALRTNEATFAFSSMEVDGVDMGFTEPKFQGIDTSCVIHDRKLVAKYGAWKNRVDGGYAHDWEFISRWVTGGEKWACTKRPTLEYNAETSGQTEFLKDLAKKNMARLGSS